MSFSVDTGDVEGLLAGLSGVLGDLEDLGGQITSGDPAAAGHPGLTESLTNYASTWSAGISQLHDSVAHMSSNLTHTAAAYEAADDAVRTAFSE